MLPCIDRSELGIVRHLPPRPYLQPGEQDVLLALVESAEPHTMIEIGVNIGLTAQAMLRHVPTIERYIGLDVDRDYQFEISAQQIERPHEPGRLVRHDPRFELILRGEVLDLPRCEVMFIDGDHGSNAVWQDSLLATMMVKPGGLIIWHDYSNPAVEVTEVLDELQAQGRELTHVAGTWLVFERR